MRGEMVVSQHQFNDIFLFRDTILSLLIPLPNLATSLKDLRSVSNTTHASTACFSTLRVLSIMGDKRCPTFVSSLLHKQTPANDPEAEA
jgi:hypothetical protein